MAASSPINFVSGFGRRDAGLWSGAAALVIVVHATAGWYAYSHAPEPFVSEPPASAVMIDLAPMAVAPDAVPPDEAELVDSAASKAVEETVEPIEEVQPDTVEAEPVEQEVAERVIDEAPEPVEEVAENVPVEPEELAEMVPDPVEVPLPEIAMMVPQPRPEPREPAPIKRRKPVEKRAAKPVREPPPSAAAQKAVQAAPRAAAPAPSASAGRSVSPAKWQSRVSAHLNRHKRFPSGAKAGGVALVQFTVNPSGAVIRASLVQSSGDGVLDRAAVALVQRASPIPAPPPDIAKASMRLTVPIQFSRR